MKTRSRSEADGMLRLVPNFDYRDQQSRIAYESKILTAFDYLRVTQRLEIKALHHEDSPLE